MPPTTRSACGSLRDCLNEAGGVRMGSRARLTIIANYLEALERPLRMAGICSDCIINSCSPLAMAGTYDGRYQKYDQDINMPMPTLLNIRKNLSAMLARDSRIFQQNYNLQPYARNVRYQNETDYIVVMNTALGYTHFVKDKSVYSDTYPQNAFITDIKADGTFAVQHFPFENGFDWKYHYDRFIDAVLSAYDSDHIILVRVNAAQWYMKAQEISPFEERFAQFRDRIEEIDDHFLERTRCLCIEEQYNYIPVKNENCAFPYSSKSSDFYKQLAADIEAVIDGRIAEFKCCSPRRRLPEQDHALSDYAIKILKESRSNDGQIDFEMIGRYTKDRKLDINDVIAVYVMYLRCEDKHAFRGIVRNMVGNEECLPVRAARRRRARNIEFLNEYPYIYPGLKNVKETDSIFIRIENHIYLHIDLTKKDFIRKVDMKIGSGFDPVKIIDNGYVCPIEQADALCSSYAFYIERARRGQSDHPVKIRFDSAKDFSDSLGIYDYADLLTNENFVITLADNKVGLSGFHAVCDLGFLLRKNTKVCVIRSGLSDQICYYIFGRKLGEEKAAGFLRSKYDIYYDDTFYLYTVCFNGLEVTKLENQGGGMVEHLISNLLTPKLKSQITGKSKLPDILYQNGLEDTVVVSPEEKKLSEYRFCHKVCSHMKPDGNPYTVLRRKLDFNPCFYYTLVRPESFLLEKRCDWSDYIVFPEFDEVNDRIAQEMLGCDAVVIHMRLGDFVSAGYDVDSGFYIESIRKLLEITEYRDKRYYIFSDNIPYVKEHTGEFGLDLIERSKITYVAHNKGEDSFRDLQLMTYARVMIASGSGVARMAFVLSGRCEQIYLWKTEVLALFEKIGRKNKYNIGGYERDYRLDYSRWKPKGST